MTVHSLPISLEARTEHYRQIAFVRGYASGKTLGRTLSAAGYTGRSESFALELLNMPNVQEEMEKTFQILRNLIAMSKEAIIAQLDEDRSFAYQQESPAAAINATVAKAKILGFLDKAETNRLPPSMELGWGALSKKPTHAAFTPPAKDTK